MKIEKISADKYLNKTAFLKAFKDALKPRLRLSVSEFTEKHIFLPSNSAMPGLINLSITPYLRQILDDLTPYNGVQFVVFVSSVQIAKSTAGICFIMCNMILDPSNSMVVLPRHSDAEDFSTERITPMLKASPIYQDVIDVEQKSSENKVGKKTYKGGFIYFTGAGSASALKSKPIKNILMDEVDEYQRDLQGQGDAVELAINRTVSFGDQKKVCMVSTPTIGGESRIWEEYEKGTMFKYFVPCPHCCGEQFLDFKKGIRYELNEDTKKLVKGSVYYECEFCQGKILNSHKHNILNKGNWIAENPDAEIRSYRLNALYSPFISFENVVNKYIASIGDRQLTKAFTNNYLGEPYFEDVVDLDVNKLFERSKESELNELQLDPKVICLTGAVDTQDNRLVVDIKGWGKNEECWTIYYKEFFGNTADADDPVWNLVKDVVYRPYKHPSGIDLFVRYCAIDFGGHRGQQVLDFAHKNSKFKAIIGARYAMKTLLSAPKKVDINFKGKYVKGGVERYNIGTELAKEEIYSRLTLERKGSKYLHFNKDLDEKYFKMLISEKKVTKYINGYPVKKWVLPSGQSNEALDTFVYNYAIARGLCHIELLDNERYEQEYRELFGDYGLSKDIVEIIETETDEESFNSNLDNESIIKDNKLTKKKSYKFRKGKNNFK